MPLYPENGVKLEEKPSPMPSYVSLIRGINVSGHKTVPMAELRKKLENEGFPGVKTYIQSGNVVYKAPQTSNLKLSQRISSAIEEKFGWSVFVVTRSSSEWDEIIKKNPYLKQKGVDIAKLHVTVLESEPSSSALEKLALIKSGRDTWRSVGSTIYLYCPDGYGKSKLTNTALEKVLALQGTSRNWKSVLELQKLGAE
jgi:uncharacterized protein (DUF1697 family)